MEPTVTNSLPERRFGVLLVDDSADDRWLMRRALLGHPRLDVVGELPDGDQVIAYLSGQGDFADRKTFPFPDAMLLDLKMPRRTGFEVLEWLRLQPFDELVVIVISGSPLPQDIARSLQLGASAYHQKSASAEAQKSLVRKIEDALGRLHNHSF